MYLLFYIVLKCIFETLKWNGKNNITIVLLQMKMRRKRMQQVKFQLEEERPNALKLNPVLSTPPLMQTQPTNNKKENEITVVMEIMNRKQRLQQKFELNVFYTLKRILSFFRMETKTYQHHRNVSLK
jgi:hypothetical protein